MSFILSNQGEGIMLTLFFAQAMHLRLYTNNYTPVATSIESNFTEETGGGYAAIAISGGAWTNSGGNPTTATANGLPFTWTFTGAANSAYGYYVTRDSDGKYLFGEKFSDGPYTIANNGDQVKITNLALNET